MAVKIYTTNSCPYCSMAKSYLKSKGISFSEINIEREPERQKELLDRTGQTGVPVIDFNGKIIIGFDRQKLDRLITSIKK